MRMIRKTKADIPVTTDFHASGNVKTRLNWIKMCLVKSTLQKHYGK